MTSILEHPAWTSRFELETQDDAVRARWSALQDQRRERLLAARFELTFARVSQELRLRPDQAEVLRPALTTWVADHEPKIGRADDLVRRVTRRMQGEDSIWPHLTEGQKSYLLRSRKTSDNNRPVGRLVEDEFVLEAEVLAQRHDLDAACLETLAHVGQMLGRRLVRDKASLRNNRRAPFASKVEPSDDAFWIKILRTEAPEAIGDVAPSGDVYRTRMKAGRSALMVATLDERLHLTAEQRAAVPEALDRLLERELDSYPWRLDQLGPQYVWESLGILQPHTLGGAEQNTNHSSVVKGAREALKSILTPLQNEELGL